MVWRVGKINLRSSFFHNSYFLMRLQFRDHVNLGWKWTCCCIGRVNTLFKDTAPNQTDIGFCYGIHTYSNVRARSQKDWYLCNERLYSVSSMFFEIVSIIALFRDLWNNVVIPFALWTFSIATYSKLRFHSLEIADLFQGGGSDSRGGGFEGCRSQVGGKLTWRPDHV